MMNDSQSLKNLLDNGADPNAKDFDGTTILHFASFAGNLESVKILSNYGADINALDYEGKSVLMAAAMNSERIVNFLIEEGADINHKDNNGYSALMTAALIGELEAVKTLIAHGADSDARNNNDETLLMCAALNSPEIVNLFIERDAEVNAESSVGYSVLDYAEMSGQQEIVKIVKTAGAE